MNDFIKKVVEHSGVQMAVVLGGVAITLVNAFIALTLRPLADDISSVAQRVDAIESRSVASNDLIQRFIIVEAKVDDIQARTDRIENKVDIILTR